MYPAVTDKQILDQVIPLPSFPEQKRIVEMLKKQMDSVERAQKAAEFQLAELESIPSVLLSRGFAGEI